MQTDKTKLKSRIMFAIAMLPILILIVLSILNANKQHFCDFNSGIVSIFDSQKEKYYSPDNLVYSIDIEYDCLNRKYPVTYYCEESPLDNEIANKLKDRLVTCNDDEIWFKVYSVKDYSPLYCVIVTYDEGKENERNFFYKDWGLETKNEYKYKNIVDRIASAHWGTYNSLLVRGGERNEIKDLKLVNHLMKNVTKKKKEQINIAADKHEFKILYLKLNDGLTYECIVIDNGYICAYSLYSGYKVNPFIFKKLWNQMI